MKWDAQFFGQRVLAFQAERTASAKPHGRPMPGMSEVQQGGWCSRAGYGKGWITGEEDREITSGQSCRIF